MALITGRQLARREVLMKWLCACVAVLFMVTPAMAGEDPYIGIVGVDQSSHISFYFSPNEEQFLFDTLAWGIPQRFGSFPPLSQYTRAGEEGSEQFRSQTLNNQPEVCHVATVDDTVLLYDDFRTLFSALTRAGNSGFYEWFIRLPKKPSGEINIVLQCGVLKPNSFAVYRDAAIEICAAETGERLGAGTCVRQEVDPGASPLINTALPRIMAIVYPGPHNVAFTPFYLTAFKNPSAYTLAFDAVSGAMSNDGNSQVLNGSNNTRIVLKACLEKSISTKLPVTGQVNQLGETETDLEGGDLIYVRLDVPRQNTVDIYCHEQSVKLAGVGETPF